MSGKDLALDLALAGTQLIEASAGTGKTFTIAGLYLRAIVERRLAVRDVLVVTFTRAATEELKQRLRERLTLCADVAETRLQTAPDDTSHCALEAGVSAERRFAQTLIERALSGADAEKPVDLARRLRLAAFSMDEAAIHTIDAFCQRALREHAFASGQALETGELVGSDSDLVTTIAEDFWRRLASDPAHAADFDVLQSKVRDPRGLAEVMQGIEDPALCVHPMPPADNTTAGPALQAAVSAHETASAALCAAWAASGEEDFGQILDHANAGHLSGNSHKPAQIEPWRSACRESFALDRVPHSEVLLKVGTGMLAKRTNKGKPALPTLLFTNAVDAWLHVDGALQQARTQRWATLLAELRAYAQQQLERRKRRAERYSYADVIRRLHAAIAAADSGAQLAASLHARHPVVLVDEFQDTDARQFAIFHAIQSAGEAGALFLVGDPKQAIYRFRGGDIEAYLAAADGARSRHRLDVNFRSTPAYLKAIEAVFSQGDEPECAFVDPRIQFHPVAPGDRARDDDVLVDEVPIAPLTCWHLPEAERRWNKDDACEQLAKGCAEQIVQLLDKARRGQATLRQRSTCEHTALAPRNLAVLVATNKEAAIMQQALAERGIASATIRQESVFATAEATDVARVLSALDGHNDAALRGALATRLFGRDAAQIATLVDAENPGAWQTELQYLDDLHQHWLRHGVLALLERVLGQRASTILGDEHGERRLTNYLQLAELLQAQAAREYSTRGLIAWLRRRIEEADRHNEAEQLHLESDADRVQIATIHASKGLEYDLVFLPFTSLPPSGSSRRPDLLAWHADEARQVRVFACGEDIKADAELTDAIAAAEREALAERIRVLYVALTRARHACWLSWDAVGSGGATALAQLWHAGARPKTSDDTLAALTRLASSADCRVNVDLVPESSGQRLEVADAAELAPARTFGGSIDRDWWIASYSQLRDGERHALADARGADDETATVTREDAEEALQQQSLSATGAIAAWPRGSSFGTAMHEILERTDFSAWRQYSAPHAPLSERDMIRTRLRCHALVAPEREEELQRVVTRMLSATLNVQLPDAAHLHAIPVSDRRAELPFHFAIGGASSERLIALLRDYGYQQRRAAFARAPTRIAGLMTGVIDLVYRHDGRWWIVDYKSNWLGARVTDYAPPALQAAVRDHDFDLQYLIYTLAMHRWLTSRLGERYDYERDFGGAIYLFLRGLALDGSRGVHVDRPPLALIEAMDTLLAAEVQA